MEGVFGTLAMRAPSAGGHLSGAGAWHTSATRREICGNTCAEAVISAVTSLARPGLGVAHHSDVEDAPFRRVM